ncbi:TRIM3-like protein [Mya arenaria]|uniref:TRIM3-like protein n=1 Tax=Mya arenaria TaxID=6604 RepID=A0ABY7EHU4_MYAAR|nr:TRIM3-like protein [Mya arenaria]
MDRCPLCFGSFQKAKLLPCLDTVCFTCLDEYVVKNARASGTFPCPVCHLEVPVPEGGISKFDDNQYIKLEQTLEKTPADPDLPCLCVRGEAGCRYCDKHKNEELTFYCRTCQFPVCMRCRLTVHEDHTTEDLVDFAVRARRELKIALDENNGFRFQMLNEIEELRVYADKMDKAKTEIKKIIGNRREQFHKSIDTLCDNMINKLETEVVSEEVRILEDKDYAETDMLTLSQKIATANQMVDFGSDIEVVRNRQDIIGSLALAKKEIPLSMTGIKLNIEFNYQKQAEQSLRYLFGRLSIDITPPNYISVSEVATFRVENTSDVINAICPSMDDKCWVACGWKSEVFLFDRFGQQIRSKHLGRDVDCLAIDSDGNAYVSCREEHSVKRFDRNFRRRMATLNIEYPRGIATTNDNKLVICVNKTTTYFDYDPSHQNRVLKLGPDGDESKELKNPSLCFMYPIRVAVNITDELCVSDNIKHAVLFLKPNGEIKYVYSGERKTDDISLVKAPTRTNLMTAKSSTTRAGTVSLKPPESRKEQDGPLESTPKSILDKTRPPLNNSPKTVQTPEQALAPINYSYESTFETSVSLESTGTLKEITNAQGGEENILVPAHIKALSGMTGALETASVTDVESEMDYEPYVPPFDPRGITCDKYGHVIVCDYSSNRVHLLDKHGRFLMYLLTEADGIFGPTSVAVDKAGFLWVGGGDATVKIYKYIDLESSTY